VGQRILMLHERRIYASGTPEQIFTSQEPVVRRFMEGVSDPKDHDF
jgi:ABC-type transporter Mla maintaining outer membrane lipid asymmetry ATPase subunit MlaF